MSTKVKRQKFYFFKGFIQTETSAITSVNGMKQVKQHKISSVIKGDEFGLFDPTKIVSLLNLDETQSRFNLEDFKEISKPQYELLINKYFGRNFKRK